MNPEKFNASGAAQNDVEHIDDELSQHYVKEKEEKDNYRVDSAGDVLPRD